MSEHSADDLPVGRPVSLPVDEDDAVSWSRSVRSRRNTLLVVAVGGVIGATARYALAEAVPIPDSGFPVATSVANVVGSFLLGVVAIVSIDGTASMRYLRPFIAVGLIGSFTTFSTFAVESVVLVDRGDSIVAAIYVLTTVVGGVAAARLGIESARRLRSSDRRADT